MRMTIVLAALFASVVARGQASPPSPRLLVHLLDYLAQDYPGAVAGGKVINSSEYQEQLEFSASALETYEKLPELQKKPELGKKIEGLRTLILQKAPNNQIATLSREIQNEIIALTGLSVAPTRWPNLDHGKKVFTQNCVVCHGAEGRGNGPASTGLDPKPVNFLDHAKMDRISPFQAFDAIRMGIPGTAMAPFPTFSEQDAWDAAFYVLSLRARRIAPASSALPEIPLETVATKSDVELSKLLQGPGKDQAAVLAALRLRSSNDDDDDNGGTLDLAREKLKKSVTDYHAGKFDSAKQLALSAYLDGVEPVEFRLRAADPAMTADLEQKMGAVRGMIERRKSLGELDHAAQKAEEMLSQARTTLQHKGSGQWLTFLVAAGIFLREGFEAVLIIIALLGVIRAAGAKSAALWVHLGWVLALGGGAIAWVFSGWLIGISGMQRELMEGVTSIFAVLVLLYLGFWLHSKTEIGRWKQFIDGRVKTALEGGNRIGLAVISFTAVFREAFEVVLFLRALWLESGADSRAAMAIGVFGSFALILALAWALLKYSTRIPIRRLFDFSSSLMIALAVILMGKGFHSLQETGLLSITALPLHLHVDLIGLYPTAETFFAQIVILGVSVALWIYGKKPRIYVRFRQ